MTSLMPETIEPATGTLPLPKVTKARFGWSHEQVAALVQKHAKGGEWDTGHSPEQDTAKLIELGLIQKAPKAGLHPYIKASVDGALEDLFVRYGDEVTGSERNLAIRYAIKALSAMLPAKAEK